MSCSEQFQRGVGGFFTLRHVSVRNPEIFPHAVTLQENYTISRHDFIEKTHTKSSS